MSLTVTLTGNSSHLENTFFPSIQLDRGEWEVALLNFEVFNSIPNLVGGVIAEGEPELGPAIQKALPTGAYEIEDIENFINEQFGAGSIKLTGNHNTLHSEVIATKHFWFSTQVAHLLGFTTKSFKPGGKYVSEKTAQILGVHLVRVLCNIAQGSFLNGEPTHAVHEFFISVPPGFQVIENPNTLLYFKINSKELSKLTLDIVDQNNRLIDFQKENITVRLHLRRVKE